MRLVLNALFSILMVTAFACGEDSDDVSLPTTVGSTPTPSATATSPAATSPTVTTGDCPLPEAQCSQAEQLRDWLQADDVEAVVAATKTNVYTCTAATGAGAPWPLCDAVAAGEQQTGVGIARRYSSGAALSVNDYHAALQAFLDAVDPAASDAGGSGALDLVAVSCVDPLQAPDECTRSVAIFSAIVRQTSIPGWGIPGGREVLLFWMTAESAETDNPVEETWTGIVQEPEVDILTSSGGVLFDLGRIFTVD